MFSRSAVRISSTPALTLFRRGHPDRGRLSSLWVIYPVVTFFRAVSRSIRRGGRRNLLVMDHPPKHAPQAPGSIPPCADRKVFLRWIHLPARPRLPPARVPIRSTACPRSLPAASI